MSQCPILFTSCYNVNHKSVEIFLNRRLLSAPSPHHAQSGFSFLIIMSYTYTTKPLTSYIPTGYHTRHTYSNHIHNPQHDHTKHTHTHTDLRTTKTNYTFTRPPTHPSQSHYLTHNTRNPNLTSHIKHSQTQYFSTSLPIATSSKLSRMISTTPMSTKSPLL